ncbi:hypothetical protein [Nocardia sp. NPDC056000]|uniref:hypothetical protein n=1 Tax=Nocardia sp. NPDC056000 TaxID=3345674 RepID=UPI0035D8B576
MTTSSDSRDRVSHQPRDSRHTRDTDATNRGGKFVAWAGFVFGSALSIAMNWLHTWLPASSMPRGWTPGVWPQIGSAVWPVTLLLAVEALARVRWRPGLAWALARYGGVGTVAGGSALISYGHVHDVLRSWDYGALGSAVGPLVLDGLMVASGFALLSESVAPQNNPTTTTDTDGSRDTVTPPPIVVETIAAIPAPTAACMDTNTHPAGPVPEAASRDSLGPVAERAREPESVQRQYNATARQQDAKARQAITADATASDRAATDRDSNGAVSRDDRILGLHDLGLKTREIAEEIGIHHSTVARVVARHRGSDISSGLRLIPTSANDKESAS